MTKHVLSTPSLVSPLRVFPILELKHESLLSTRRNRVLGSGLPFLYKVPPVNQTERRDDVFAVDRLAMEFKKSG